ncbi:hypothetical protein [Enterobacter hormaechei]|uniref:hypothetical protein n=1 Tax=Enterobacter hormaechei TaxID=158836 RepID=UPI00403A7D10
MSTITREFTKEQLIERLLALQERYEWALAAVPEKKDTAVDLQITKIALAVLTAEPFMYAVADSTGCAVFGEHCVNKNPGELEDELQEPNDGFYDDTYGCRVVPVYHLPLVEVLK